MVVQSFAYVAHYVEHPTNPSFVPASSRRFSRNSYGQGFVEILQRLANFIQLEVGYADG